MKTSASSTALLFSALAVCLPFASVFGQASVSLPKQQTPLLGYPGRTHSHVDPALLETEREAWEAIAQGEAALKSGDPKNAIVVFQEALTYEPDNVVAYRDLANCYIALGNTAKAIEAERSAVYANDRGRQIIHETDTANLMEFASLLDKAGQTAEAATIYNYAVFLFQSSDGDLKFGRMMPLIGTRPGQVDYTSAHLQALVHVGLGIPTLYTQELKHAERLAHLRQAVLLYPDSPVIYAYLSKELEMMQDTAGASAAWDKANALGLPQVTALMDAQEAAMQAQQAQTAGK